MSKTDLLRDSIAQELLNSRELVRLAYTWTDGTPRVVPIWFHWDGTRIVMGTPTVSPKLKALALRPDVSLTIDTSVFPYHVLLVRGVVEIEHVVGAPPEVAAAAERYLGPDQGRMWMQQAGGLFRDWVRLGVVPTFVEIIDYETRMPSAIAAAIASHSSA
jgi:Pyridoxamine 5'-phosphate oxidase